MARRHQQQSDKFPFASPTTPGLYVTFRAYIIELICLNTDKKIGPRFWSDTKFWGPKFRREVKGVDNVLKQFEEMSTMTQTAFIKTIKDRRIKSLMHKSTVVRVAKQIRNKEAELVSQRDTLMKQAPVREIDEKKNSTFVDTGKKSVVSKIREAENG